MRVSALLVFLPLLAGCTDADWQSLTSFGGRDHADVAQAAAPADVPAATPAPAAPASNAFCQNVARQDATGNDFDPATQQLVAQRSYQQCVTIFGN